MPALVETTVTRAGALTVAGQRRIHTVVPSILAALFVLSSAAADDPCHQTIFDDINILKWKPAGKSKANWGIGV